MEFVDPLIGKQLGNYRLDQRLGQGACGIVYRCEHIKLQTPFAVKILHPVLASNEVSAERFLREARTAALIQHENIVFIADFDVDPSIGPYFVMEYLDGLNLRDIIDQAAPFGAARIANMCQQICSALAEAHRAGVIHRDLKPENICILQRPQRELVKILDFGIAKISRDASMDSRNLTQHGRVLGTPRYIAPEQAQGAEIDRRSDIYAFGIMLYEMLVGEPPFDGNTPEELVQYHLTMPPPPLDEERFPDELRDLLNWLLAKKPEERPDDMEEVWALLDEALHQMQHAEKHARDASNKHISSGIIVSSATSSKTTHPTPNGLAYEVSPLTPSLPVPRGTSSSSTQLIDVLVDVLNPQAAAASPPQAHVLAQAIKAALDKETDVHQNQPPEVLAQAIQEAIGTGNENSPQHKELLVALEDVFNVPVTDMAPSSTQLSALQNEHIGSSVQAEHSMHSSPSSAHLAQVHQVQADAWHAETQRAQLIQELHPPNSKTPTPDSSNAKHGDSEESDETLAYSSAQAEKLRDRMLQDATSEASPIGSQHTQGSSSGSSNEWSTQSPVTEHSTTYPPAQVSVAITTESRDHAKTPPVDTAHVHPAEYASKASRVGVSASGLQDSTPAHPEQGSVDTFLDASPVELEKASRTGRYFNILVSIAFHPIGILFILLVIGGILWAYTPFDDPKETGTPQPTRRRPKTPCFAHIQLHTQPKGVSVEYQGKQLGRTPLVHKAVCAEPIELTLRASGYKTQKQFVNLQAGSREYTFVLQKKVQKRWFRLYSRPKRVAIYYKKRRALCTTPCTLRIPTEGIRTYTLRKRGYKTRKFRISTRAKRTQYTVRLRRIRRRRRRYR